MHVDEMSLESVVDDQKAGELGGNFCRVVNKGSVLLSGEEREASRAMGIEPYEPDEEDALDLEKRVRVNDLVSLYAFLQNDTYDWYYIPMHDGTAGEMLGNKKWWLA